MQITYIKLAKKIPTLKTSGHLIILIFFFFLTDKIIVCQLFFFNISHYKDRNTVSVTSKGKTMEGYVHLKKRG